MNTIKALGQLVIENKVKIAKRALVFAGVAAGLSIVTVLASRGIPLEIEPEEDA